MTSEKDIEKELVKRVERLGGWTIKLLSFFVKGLPDRLCLFPGGRAAFAEIKTRSKKAKPAQNWVHRKLKGLGFIIHVIDSEEKIDGFIKLFEEDAE